MPNHDHSGFYRVWAHKNMALAKVTSVTKDLASLSDTFSQQSGTVIGTGQHEEIDFEWQSDHLVVKDMYLLGEVSPSQVLFYSYTDRQLMIYDLRIGKERVVVMELTPKPKTLTPSRLHNVNSVPQVRDIVLHPKFPLTGNNFVVIVDFNNEVHMCKAQFHPVDRPGDASKSVLDFVKRLPKEGECELDV